MIWALWIWDKVRILEVKSFMFLKRFLDYLVIILWEQFSHSLNLVIKEVKCYQFDWKNKEDSLPCQLIHKILHWTLQASKGTNEPTQKSEANHWHNDTLELYIFDAAKIRIFKTSSCVNFSFSVWHRFSYFKQCTLNT